MITIKDLKKKNASQLLIDFFQTEFGDKISIQEIIKRKFINSYYIRWLIAKFKCFQTKEMIDYYKTLNVLYYDIDSLIVKHKFCQTQEMLDFYKSLNPPYYSISWIIARCKFCQTQEMIEYYKSSKPKHTDVIWLIENCKFCQTKEMINYYCTLNQSEETIKYLEKIIKRRKNENV